MAKIINIPDLLEVAESAAREAGKVVMEEYQSADFSTAMKSDQFPVTMADRRAHAIITERLGETNLPVLSEEGVLIEFEERKNWDYFWLIDPLDGTREFLDKNGEFTVNIALVKQSLPVGGVIYVPCANTLYKGSRQTGISKNEKGKLVEFLPLAERTRFPDLVQREKVRIVASRSHMTVMTSSFIKQFPKFQQVSLGSSLKFMMLLENRADIYPRFGSTMEWDTAAAHAILNASNRGVYLEDLKAELIYNKPDLTNPYFIAF